MSKEPSSKEQKAWKCSKCGAPMKPAEDEGCWMYDCRCYDAVEPFTSNPYNVCPICTVNQKLVTEGECEDCRATKPWQSNPRNELDDQRRVMAESLMEWASAGAPAQDVVDAIEALIDAKISQRGAVETESSNG